MTDVNLESSRVLKKASIGAYWMALLWGALTVDKLVLQMAPLKEHGWGKLTVLTTEIKLAGLLAYN
jgi:hypothetical protein